MIKAIGNNFSFKLLRNAPRRAFTPSPSPKSKSLWKNLLSLLLPCLRLNILCVAASEREPLSQWNFVRKSLYDKSGQAFRTACAHCNARLVSSSTMKEIFVLSEETAWLYWWKTSAHWVRNPPVLSENSPGAQEAARKEAGKQPRQWEVAEVED